MLPERERLLPAYFGWTEGGKNVQRKIRVERSEDDTGEIRENYYLQLPVAVLAGERFEISRGERPELTCAFLCMAPVQMLKHRLTRYPGLRIGDIRLVAVGFHPRFGWLDGIAWYKQNSVKAELLSWETVQSVQAHDHLPLRALMRASWQNFDEHRGIGVPICMYVVQNLRNYINTQ